ncbi:PilN domain-containing protein [Bacillus salitolerans]|uniref:PilN domain-containing protein n=1 Tax=Bacillus salitolerans TaxID=1437434 RepID=A0ABW4LMU3_9BACI
MLVDINLLPEKQKRNFALYVVLFFVLTASIIGAIIFYLQYQHNTQQVKIIQQQIQDTKMLRTVQEKKLTDYASSSAVAELETAINWTQELPIPTVFLMRHLSALLPERGYMLNFSYTDDGSVNLTVQFDTSREAAYYLKSLKDSEFIDTVNLTSLVTSAADDEPEVKELVSVLLPRYIGEFQIQLNKSALRDADNKEAK